MHYILKSSSQYKKRGIKVLIFKILYGLKVNKNAIVY